MRKIITASLWVVALVLAAGFHFPLKALGALGAIMTALTLPDVSNSLIDVVAAHPSLTTDALPLLLVAAVLASMALTFVWPHAVADLLHKPRIKCTFDPNLRACFLQTTATSYIAVVGPGITSSVDYTLASSPAYTSSDISKGFQDGPFRSEERKYARIQVESGGQYDVENCSASLVSINLSGDTFVYNDGPIALTIAPAERQNAEFKNISPGRPEYIDVFYVTKQDWDRVKTDTSLDQLQCRFCSGQPPSAQSHWAQPRNQKNDNAMISIICARSSSA